MIMLFEFSAGGLVVKKTADKWLLLVIKDTNDSWTFPKGLIEKNEKALDAAQREISEETGLSNLFFLTRLSPILYWYRRGGQPIKKSVKYFLFEYTGNEVLKPQTEEGISEIKWIPLMDTLDIIGYKKTNEKLIFEAVNYLKQNNNITR